ncbi:abc transporter g family member [Anaeramoeba flamelloides]|uniref:Abc transporter g family member n=1 Tax=Anaeramoeba flamelloides TaxID=1746091 RepID=A0AAV7Y8T3_9EUKA|nr:abc transporter g family member [Anaeramoeba flamelloides]|eukprot:Anaeramoba_flamelloidesa818160_61.p1 GENE.a818160_61~~a818160_61.p1  ORF type:complete len:727 (+),score=130.30 a818160_61:26-2206(+)
MLNGNEPYDDEQMTLLSTTANLASDGFQGVSVEAKDLSFQIKGKTILNNVNITIEPGNLVCLLGPSGAGKTTLLSTLAGRAPHKGTLYGEVLYGGEELTEDYFPSISFTTQDDILLNTLTPTETLNFVGKLVLPKNTTKEERTKRVNTVIQMLKLEHCRDTIIGSYGRRSSGISGGERKRLNIGTSLISEPQVLFLDEPTSGLDSNTAFSVISLLKDLSLRGLTVICSIHQPRQEIFTLFDKSMVLSKGSVIYYGPVRMIRKYFQTFGLHCRSGVNQADWMVQLVEIKEKNTYGLPQLEINYKKPKRKRRNKYYFSSSDDLIDSKSENGTNAPKIVNLKNKKNADKSERDRNGNENRNNTDGNHNQKDGNDDLDQDIIVSNSDEEYSNDENDDEFEGEIKNKPGTLAFVKELIKRYQKSKLFKLYAKPDHCLSDQLTARNSVTRNEFYKSWVLIHRGMITTIREKQKLIKIFAGVFVALFVGSVFYDLPLSQTGVRDRMGLLFFSLIATLLISMISVLHDLPYEKVLFLKESQDRTYSAMAYLNAKMVCDFPFEVIIPIFYSIILYNMTKLRKDWGAFFIFLLTTIMIRNVGATIGFLLSSVSKSSEIGLGLAPPVIIPQLIFTGFLVDFDTIPAFLRWFRYINPMKYAFEVLINNEFTDLKFGCTPSELVNFVCPFTTGDQVLNYYAYNDVNYTESLLLLLLFLFILKAFTYFGVYYSKRREIGK